MNINPLEVITATSVLVALAAIIWLVVVTFRREKYTRERFAFSALAAFLPLAVAILSSLADKRSIWDSIGGIVRSILHLPTDQSAPPSIEDHVLMVIVLIVVGIFLERLYRNWDGAYSVRQKELQKYHEPMPFVNEALFEAKRLVMRGKPLELYVRANVLDSVQPVFSLNKHSLAWHHQARDLVCMANRSYQIDPDEDWHDSTRCWIGYNSRTTGTVAIRCDQEPLTSKQYLDFVEYVQRVSSHALALDNSAELIVAIRDAKNRETVTVDGQTLRVESEDSLLHDLVNFTDYFAAIRSRVERQHLTDSELKLSDVYTVASCRSEDGLVHQNVESYVLDWAVEKSRRQLAMLGEFGQGKSTTALMLVYRLVKRLRSEDRVPILIELRGKSPRNLTPEELIATWAYPFGIDTRAVMKLLIAGKLLLILEGFDEMTLAGDSESRLAHFRTLWSLCHEGSKILITGRPNLFLDDKEMRTMLGIQKYTAVGPYCEAIYLEPFSLSQISSALRSSPEGTAKEILDLAGRDQKFMEIVSRGSLLYVVSQLWARENLSRFVNQMTSALVMDLFIRHSFRRQSQKISSLPDFMVLNESERVYFTSGVAAIMGAVDLPNQISVDLFTKTIKDLYDRIPDSVSAKRTAMEETDPRPLNVRLASSDDPVEDICNDVRAASLLVFDQSKSGNLRFAHKSFMEFMAANVYASYLNGDDRECFSALIAATHLSARHILRMPVSQIFFAELLLSSLQRNKMRSHGKNEAQMLFELIVMRPNGRGFRSVFLSRLAFFHLRLIAIALQLVASKSVYSRILGTQWLVLFGRSVRSLVMLTANISLLPMGLALILMTGRARGHILHELFNYKDVLAVLTSGAAMITGAFVASGVSATSTKITPGISLWLACCEILEIPKQDVASVCGSTQLLTEHGRLKRYLEL